MYDDFSSNTINNYTQYANTMGTWSISDGLLTSNMPGGNQSVLVRNNYYKDDVDIIVYAIQSNDGGIVCRLKDNNNYYLITIYDSNSTSGDTNAIKIWKKINGNFTQLTRASINFPRGISTKFRVVLKGSAFNIYVNDVLVINNFVDTSITGAGLIGLRNNAGIASYDSIYVSDLNFVSPDKINIDDSIITKIVFKRNNVILGTINNPIVNQNYNILDYVSGLNYKDVLVVEEYDANNNLFASLSLNVKEDFTGKQGILVTTNSIDTKDWDSIDSIQAIGDLYSDDLVPTLTSNTSASPIVVSASSNSSNAWLAFNGTCTVSELWWKSAIYNLTGWLKIDFGVPKIVNKYIIYGRGGSNNENPKNWTFEGSNDDINWIVLDTRTNEINWKDFEQRSYLFNNTTAYRYYRINMSANNGNIYYITIAEMELIYLHLPNYYLLSNDNKQTWYTYQNNQFIPVTNPTSDIFTQGITDLSFLPSLTKQNFLKDKLDIMVGMRSGSTSDNPLIKGININYNINDYIINNYSKTDTINVNNSEYIYQSGIVDNIYKFNFSISGDNYKVFLSKDGGNTWLTYNGIDFIVGGEGNYIWEINNLSQELLMQFLPISNFRLKFEPIDSSAVLNNITINYSVKTNSILPSDAKEALLPVPPEYFRNVLQEDNTYTLKLEEGLSFDDANKDYDFYTTPTKVKLRPLDMGTVIGNKWSVVQAFEVINSHENQDYDIELKVAYNNEEAIIKDNTALLNDTDLDSEKTIVEFSLTQDPFELIYPVKFRLDRNSKQVVYFKIKPTIVTEGTKTFQIRLTATPL